MAENLKKRPSKSILKNSSSFDIHDSTQQPSKKKNNKGNAKWDEMNIMATLHPADKDYGFMKIDEPKTPYNYEGLDVDPDSVDANELAKRLQEAGSATPKVQQGSSMDEDDDDDLTPEQRAAKKEFEMKRKKHYNEYYAVKLAKKLLEQEEEDDDDDDDASRQQSTTTTTAVTTTKKNKS